MRFGEFPGGPVVRTQRFHCGGPGSILLGELRSCKLHSEAKLKKKKKMRFNSWQLTHCLGEVHHSEMPWPLKAIWSLRFTKPSLHILLE